MAKQLNRKGRRFHLFDNSVGEVPINGIYHLNPALTLNSITVYPSYRYKGGDANSLSWVPWGYGNELRLVTGVALPSYKNGSPLLGNMDDSVLFNTGDYYKLKIADGTGKGRIDDEDFVFEFIFKTTGTTSIIFAKRNAGVGYQVGIDANDKLYMIIEDATGSTTFTVDDALTPDIWYYCMIFSDRDGNTSIYLNGSPAYTPVATTRVLTINTTEYFVIGSDSAGNSPYDKNLSYLCMWKYGAWLDTDVQTSVCFERFMKLTGMFAKHGFGYKIPSFTRSTISSLIKIRNGEKKIYKVGASWPRMTQIPGSNGKMITGFLSELASTNLVTYSEQLDHANWNAGANITVTANQEYAPDDSLTAEKLAAANGDASHGVYQEYTCAAAVYCLSVFAKAGDIDYLWINLVGDAKIWFNLTTGLVGTVEAGIDDYGMEYYGNGWWRCWATDTCSAGTDNAEIYIANDDNVTNFNDNGKYIYAWGAQIEQREYPSSYIQTVASTVTRNKDQLNYYSLYNIGGNLQSNSISFKMKLPDTSLRTTNAPVLIDINNGTTTDGLAISGSAEASSQVSFTTINGGVSENTQPSYTVSNGSVIKCKVVFDKLGITGSVDGTESNSLNTLSGETPTTIDIGQLSDDSLQIDGVISDISIYGYKKEIKSIK